MFYLLGLIALLGIVMLGFGPVETIDKKVYYSGDEARALLQSFSAENWRLYLLNEILDVCLIMVYTAFFIVSLKKCYPKQAWLLLIPLIGGMADMVETVTIIGVLQWNFSQDVFDWLGIMTVAKWVGTVASIVLLLLQMLRRRTA